MTRDMAHRMPMARRPDPMARAVALNAVALAVGLLGLLFVIVVVLPGPW